jgi:uncharacterized protein (TIGR03067 family)
MEPLLLEADAHETDVLRDEAARKDRERLQGAWAFVSGRREAQLLFVGDHFIVNFTGGDIYVGTFCVDPTQNPRAMDMTITEGPAHHRGKTSLGIYELTEDRLIWCPAHPGTEDRLPAFPPAEDVRHLCLVFRRTTTRRGVF